MSSGVNPGGRILSCRRVPRKKACADMKIIVYVNVFKNFFHSAASPPGDPGRPETAAASRKISPENSCFSHHNRIVIAAWLSCG
jgi:hypothetical protein